MLEQIMVYLIIITIILGVALGFVTSKLKNKKEKEED